ncbi:glycerol kinase [Tenacibaculum skagerrakense]|uniref:Glycerol kinase n=1 Tax=Tenacibaculum skagerrakense TaxID=186571 RepID=A0A4V2SML9_9FLAO|nr:glycerol kinase GlpK [Tenacibaculum skagerrakense]TCP27846.1 glycerol kinase [Tenacibaculum skagerrakense]
MKQKYLVAFDQGTTSTRTIIFDEKGQIKAIAQKELTQHYPKSGWVEHNPIEIFNDQQATFLDALQKSGITPDEIAAVGITNQRETTVVWDKETGEPIYNAIVWLDKRTNEICEDLKNRGLSNYVKEHTGLVIDSYFSATKLKWILESVEGAKEKANDGKLCFGTIDSWLIYKFTNHQKHVTDHTNASRTMIYDIKNLAWDDTLLKALDIPSSLLPRVQPSSSHFGDIDLNGTIIPIYGVAGDQQASLFGQGGFKAGIAKNTYGTGCFMLLNTGNKQVLSQSGLLTTLTCSLESDSVQYALEGSIFVGGASIQWLRDRMNLIDNAADTEEICNSIPPLKNIYVVPAFAGLGAPYWDADAKGSIYGMTLDTGKNEIIKATVEALAYQTKDVITAMIKDSGKEMITLKVDGGASANNYLMQFQSDILNVAVDRPKMIEVTAFGAALLAGIKAGVWTKNDIETIREVDTIFTTQMKPKVRKKKYKGWLKAIERTQTLKKKNTSPVPVRFSVLDRDKHLKKLKSETFDLLIIGGGITGAGIALDASSRGMKVCLVEKNDFASGTSNKSTKLIHGGLRYLKQLEIGLVRESGSERAIVHKLAPHLVIPEKMLLPLIEGGTYGKMMTAIGLKVYDLLANVGGNDARRMLDKKETMEKEPMLDENITLGSGYYAEYRTDDARLTIEILKKASEFGATIINYCEMESFVYDKEGKIEYVQCVDVNTGKKLNVKARNYVSAAGPWVDLLREKDTSKNNKYLHLTKGVHIVFPHEKLPIKQSVYFDVPDGRMVFAIPRGRCTYVGTTDTNYSGNLDRVVATKDDAEYLLEAVNSTFPDVHLTINDIESNWAGLRPLIHEEEKDPSELSRKDEIFISKSGLISIAGGKLTGYRKMAHRVIEAVLKTMDEKRRNSYKKSQTENILLVNPSLHSVEEVEAYQKELKQQLSELGMNNPYYAWHLCTTYGKRANTIIERTSFFASGTIEQRLIRAELWYCINYEMTNSLADFFVRRTGRLYFNIESITKHLDIILKDFIRSLDWDDARIAEEKNVLNQLLADATTYYDTEF